MAGYSADDPQKTYLITKDKLKCLYQQTDSLLKEADPVIVFLSSECAHLPIQLNSGERSALPKLSPKIGSHVTLKPEDVLVLSHIQLHCFKRAYAKFMKQTQEPILVRFADSCDIDNGDKQ